MTNDLPIRLVIPDAGVLISLAHGDLLDLLFRFRPGVHLVVTDVVIFEATRRTDKFDALRIQEFMEKNVDRIEIDATGFHALIEQAGQDPKIQLPEDIGEISIYGYINAIRKEAPGIPTLVLFEDKWFMDNQYMRPRNTHLLSLAAFLRFLEKVVPNFSFDDAMDRIRATRPKVHSIEIDNPAQSNTTWKSSIRSGK